MEKAIALLSFPKELGQHPQSGEGISVGLGRFGPYIKVGDTFVSLKKEDSPYTITLNRAVELFDTSGKQKIAIGTYKKKPIYVQKGRFGHFIVVGKERIGLPKGTDPASVTEADAIARIEARLNAGGTLEDGDEAAPAKKAPARAKPTAKKPAGKTRKPAAASKRK
jgi:DNA topoisomerase I